MKTIFKILLAMISFFGLFYLFTAFVEGSFYISKEERLTVILLTAALTIIYTFGLFANKT